MHILTAHPGGGQWVNPQAEYVYQNTTFYIMMRATDHQSHADNLDGLAKRVRHGYIVFLDGDAFPIRKGWDDELLALVDEHSFVAVQRKEATADGHPHPLLCATTAELWHDRKLSWKKGFKYRNSAGEMITDVGAGILEKRQANHFPWKRLLRMNKTNVHPMAFGLYGDPDADLPMVYHHGAGFRTPLFRSETLGASKVERDAITQRNIQAGADWYDKLIDDPGFWRELYE